MVKWIPVVVGAVVALLGISDVGSFVSGFITAYPAVAAALAGLATIIASILKSPVAPKV